MPQTETVRLRHLATNGLVRDDKGNFYISNEAIAAASQIISNFVDYNPELGFNVMRILRGDQPTTYFLTSLTKQKTR